MKILLPDYNYTFENDIAEVKDNVLYIYRNGIFKDVMYELTYLIFGNNKCYFCHRKLRDNMTETDNKLYFSQITLDHLIPQDFGGITVPNNLRPTCSECNSAKGNMYPDEFEEYNRLPKDQDKSSKKERQLFKERLLNTQEKRRYGELPSIPSDWLSKEEFQNIYVTFWISHPLGVSYYKQERFYKKYKRLPKKIVISANKFLLDGFNSLMLSKNMHKEPIDVIVLENVIFRGFPQF